MFVGWDWASTAHDVTVIDSAGERMHRMAIPHTEDGIARAVAKLADYGDPGELPVAIEATRGLVVDRLLGAGHPVIPVHPNAFHAVRPRWGSARAKNDPGDSFKLADYARTDIHRLPVLVPTLPETLELQTLTRQRDCQLALRIAAVSQLAALLDQHWPGGKTIFAQLHSPIAGVVAPAWRAPGSGHAVPEQHPADLVDYHDLGGSTGTATTPTRRDRRAAPGGRCAAGREAAEHMVPGYSIIPPSDTTVDGKPVYGSYTVVNHWPQKLSEQRTLYLNQFTGATITNATAAQDGALSRLTSFGIAMHMGNQLGLLTRISATVACLGVLTSVITAFLMWWKRRPAGRTGLPGPASDTTRADTPRAAVIAVCVIGAVLGVLYPAFGASLLLVLAAEAVLTLRRRSQPADSQTQTPDHQPDDVVADGEGDDTPVGALHEIV